MFYDSVFKCRNCDTRFVHEQFKAVGNGSNLVVRNVTCTSSQSDRTLAAIAFGFTRHAVLHECDGPPAFLGATDFVGFNTRET